MRIPTTALLLLVALGCSSCVQYLPKEVWRSADNWRFFEDWFGDQLAAMREPSLLSISQEGASAEQYRLLVLPSFSPGYAIRVTHKFDGDSEIKYTELDGAGGYEPGKISKQSVREIPQQQVDDLKETFEAINFWGLPTELDRSPKPGEVIHVCTDGTRFVFETVSGGQYKLFHVHECRAGEVTGLAELISLFHELAGQNWRGLIEFPNRPASN
jgi:hypothetical protein